MTATPITAGSAALPPGSAATDRRSETRKTNAAVDVALAWIVASDADAAEATVASATTATKATSTPVLAAVVSRLLVVALDVNSLTAVISTEPVGTPMSRSVAFSQPFFTALLEFRKADGSKPSRRIAELTAKAFGLVGERVGAFVGLSVGRYLVGAKVGQRVGRSVLVEMSATGSITY